jgi:hypothetical protein
VISLRWKTFRWPKEVRRVLVEHIVGRRGIAPSQARINASIERTQQILRRPADDVPIGVTDIST